MKQRRTSHTATVCRKTDTGHTADGGHITKFQGGDTTGSGCLGLQAEKSMREKSHSFTAYYCPAKELYYCFY